MYWLEATAGQNRIMRAWMSGESSSISSMTESYLHNTPQGLALDIVHEHLYYTAAYGNQIIRMELDGSNATVMTLPRLSVQSPGAIAVFKVSRGTCSDFLGDAS